MKKVKIMLLSLALFAVVGGALAFKAKFDQSFCTNDAYFDQVAGTYYCSFKPVGAATTTKLCPNLVQNSFYTDASGVLKVCTTTTNGIPASPCNNVVCETPTWTIAHN